MKTTTTFRTIQGSEVIPFGRWRFVHVWAKRVADGAVRKYALADLRAEGGAAEIMMTIGALPQMKPQAAEQYSKDHRIGPEARVMNTAHQNAQGAHTAQAAPVLPAICQHRWFVVHNGAQTDIHMRDNAEGREITVLANVRPEIAVFVAAVPELYAALHALEAEIADYIRVNHLGPTHHNASMQMARAALSRAQEVGS